MATATLPCTASANLVLSRDLMHSHAYHQYEAQIMKPRDEFFVLLDQRAGGAGAEAQRSAPTSGSQRSPLT